MVPLLRSARSRSSMRSPVYLRCFPNDATRPWSSGEKIALCVEHRVGRGLQPVERGRGRLARARAPSGPSNRRES